MDAFQPFAAVLLVLGLLCGSLVLLKKRGAASFRLKRLPTSEKRMELVERLPLGANHALHLVRLGNRSLIIATAPGGCRLICDADPSGGKA